MTKIAIGNYVPDLISTDQATTDHVNNVVPTTNGFGPLRGLNSIAATLASGMLALEGGGSLLLADGTAALKLMGLSSADDRILGLFGCLDKDNGSHIFAGTSSALFKLNAVSREWEEVTRASGGYSMAEREYWSFALFGQNVIAVADGNNPQVYTIGESATFSDLSGDPPQARGVTVVGDFLVLYGLTEFPSRIHWSGLNDITQWAPGVSSSDYQQFPDGGYVRGVAGGEFGVVLQDSAIRRMIFNPGSAAVFDFSRVADDAGILMPYSLVPSGNSAFFFAHDGFYRIDPTGQLTPVGANKVNTTILGALDATNPRFMTGAADPVHHRIVWAYKSKDNLNSAKLDRLVIYDWSLDRWSAADCELEYLTTASPLSATLEGIDALGYTLDTLPFSLDSYISTPEFKLAGVGLDHKLGFFDGDTLEATLDTPEGSLGEGARMKVRAIAPLTDASGVKVKTAVRDHLQAAKTYSVESAASARSGYAGARGSGRFASARIRIPAGTSWTYINGVDVDAVNVGRS